MTSNSAPSCRGGFVAAVGLSYLGTLLLGTNGMAPAILLFVPLAFSTGMAARMIEGDPKVIRRLCWASAGLAYLLLLIIAGSASAGAPTPLGSAGGGKMPGAQQAFNDLVAAVMWLLFLPIAVWMFGAIGSLGAKFWEWLHATLRRWSLVDGAVNEARLRRLEVAAAVVAAVVPVFGGIGGFLGNLITQ